jgi:hypothetical protein
VRWPIGGVKHKVTTFNNPPDSGRAGEPLDVRLNFDGRREGPQVLSSRLGFLTTNIGLGVEDLPIEVAQLQSITVDEAQKADPARGQAEGGPRSQAADAKDSNASAAKALLGDWGTDFRGRDISEVRQLPAVALKLVGR